MAFSTPGAKTTLAIAMVGLVGAIAIGVISSQTGQLQVLNHGTEVLVHAFLDGGEYRPGPDGGGIVCAHQTGYAYAPALQLFGLDAGLGVPGAYCVVDLCAPLTDAGAEPALPAGMIALEATQDETPYDGGPLFYAGLSNSVGPCACSSGVNCTWQRAELDGGTSAVAAPVGLTLQPGTFTGTGCMPKACTELGGLDSWRSECPSR